MTNKTSIAHHQPYPHTQHFCPFQNQNFIMPQSAKILDMMHSKILKRRTLDEGMLKNVKNHLH